MSPISSATLFHFTDAIDNVVDILTNEFRPHYSLEDWTLITDRPVPPEQANQAFPLVSFCDIPLSQASLHMGTYGDYGLGLKKEWGMRNGVAPVLYCYPNSPVNHAVARLFHLDLATEVSERATPAAEAGPSAEDELIDSMTLLNAYLKPYEGPFHRRGRTIPKVRFYDEREWRYVPDFTQHGVEVLLRDEYLDFTTRTEANRKSRSLPPLSFEPSDINYIIVATETEILPMVHEVERIKFRYSEDQRRLLSTRIISAEHVRSDL